ncbi:MAG: UUP1 family membrane protein [Elainellaceae cyanobacterium]
MGKTTHALLLALFLTAVGLTIFFHKVFAANVPLLPTQVYKSWYVEAKLSVQSQRSLLESEEMLPQTVQVQLPDESSRFTVVRENFVNDGFTREIDTVPIRGEGEPSRSAADEGVKDKGVKDEGAEAGETSPQQTQTKSGNRVALFTNEGTRGAQTLFYRAIVDQKQIPDLPGEDILPSARRLVSQQYDSSGAGEVADNLKENLPSAEIEALIAEAEQSADDNLAIAANLYQLALSEDDIRVQAVRDTLGAQTSAAEMTAFLLNRGQVPARVGNGILLTQDEAYSTDFVHWLEVQDGDSWVSYDPIARQFGPQERYLTWWYGAAQPVVTQGPGSVQLDVLVRPNTDSGLTQAVWQNRRQNNALINYSLLRLPLATQRVFQILVLIPIGALIVAALHQIVGLQTFGTFTPILISLAFRETGLAVGIPLFISIVILGLVIRAYLNQLQLLIVPRLASILTATVLIIGLVAIAMHELQITFGLSVSLFPIVILAMTIERAAVMWEEDGSQEVMVAGLGSLFVSILGYLCLVNDYVQHIAFAFPELLLVVLALTILVGRYNGYKLTEYLRFRAMQQQLQQSGG